MSFCAFSRSVLAVIVYLVRLKPDTTYLTATPDAGVRARRSRRHRPPRPARLPPAILRRRAAAATRRHRARRDRMPADRPQFGHRAAWRSSASSLAASRPVAPDTGDADCDL